MSDRILFSIGEALIDMIPSRVGCSFDEVPAFSPRVGGAPANVCAAVARLGGRSALLSQLGDDPFGHKIARVLAGCGVELSHLEFTSKASTALAFVSLAENGQRTFSFCRKPSADLLYAPEQIDPGWFSQAFALHFCSVSLVDSPMRYAHLAAITAAREAGAILSFDPNLRFPLWPDREQLRQTVWQFLPLTHILKLSDEELPFLTGTEDIEAALPTLFTGDVQLVLYTCGSKGARAYTRTASARALTGAGPRTGGNFQTSVEVQGIHGLLADQLIVAIDKLYSESVGIHSFAGQVEVQNRVLLIPVIVQVQILTGDHLAACQSDALSSPVHAGAVHHGNSEGFHKILGIQNGGVYLNAIGQTEVQSEGLGENSVGHKNNVLVHAKIFREHRLAGADFHAKSLTVPGLNIAVGRNIDATQIADFIVLVDHSAILQLEADVISFGIAGSEGCHGEQTQGQNQGHQQRQYAGMFFHL